jgi:hypothetical protein
VYSTLTGRFLSADTIVADGLNRYAYAKNAPVIHTDVSGRCSTCDLDAFQVAENALTVAFNGSVSNDVAQRIFVAGWNGTGTSLRQTSNLISNAAHVTLQILGFTPIVGFIFDLADALLYVAEGQAHQATLSAIAAIPIVGDSFGVFKPVRYVDELSDAYKAGKVAFKSGDAFKRAYGNAPAGTEWHHIVERSQEVAIRRGGDPQCGQHSAG